MVASVMALRLARYQPEPSGKIATPRERGTIANRGRQRRRIQYANARNCGQASSSLIRTCCSYEFVIVGGDTPVQRSPLCAHVVHQCANTRAERWAFIRRVV